MMADYEVRDRDDNVVGTFKTREGGVQPFWWEEGLSKIIRTVVILLFFFVVPIFAAIILSFSLAQGKIDTEAIPQAQNIVIGLWIYLGIIFSIILFRTLKALIKRARRRY